MTTPTSPFLTPHQLTLYLGQTANNLDKTLQALPGMAFKSLFVLFAGF